LSLDDVLFLPAHDSPLRTAEPHASAFHRFAMVALAIDDVSSYRVSDAELVRQGRSYTIDTLRSFHAEGWRPGQLFFILGADAFADISAWHAFPAVLDAAHFVVSAAAWRHHRNGSGEYAGSARQDQYAFKRGRGRHTDLSRARADA
jgi:nicotinate-nucleotide adenylyltransferase